MGFHIANPLRDRELLELARREAFALADDPERSRRIARGAAIAAGNGSGATIWRGSAEHFHREQIIMRVIAGTYRSRILKSLKGLALRPTSDRLRETLFNVLGAGIAGSRFLDVFAGTGAVGIEALSRGADASHLHRESRSQRSADSQESRVALKVHSGVTVICADAIRGLETLEAK